MSQLRDMAQNLPYDLGKTFNYNIDQIVAKRMSKNGTIDGIDIDTLVLDCEGAFYYILQEILYLTRDIIFNDGKIYII